MKIIPPQLLLEAYSSGIFPMSDHRKDEEFQWYSASRRGIIPMDQFHVSKNVRRLIRQQRFQATYNQDFRQVITGCAERESTWISDLIIDSYCYLHELGYAHSVEIWDGKKLVGGLYGVSLGGAYFGESMFKREPEADKVAMYYCHKRMAERDFVLWDTQFYSEHLSQFGCIEITDKQYNNKLKEALSRSVYFDEPPPETIAHQS